MMEKFNINKKCSPMKKQSSNTVIDLMSFVKSSTLIKVVYCGKIKFQI